MGSFMTIWKSLPLMAAFLGLCLVLAAPLEAQPPITDGRQPGQSELERLRVEQWLRERADKKAKPSPAGTDAPAELKAEIEKATLALREKANQILKDAPLPPKVEPGKWANVGAAALEIKEKVGTLKKSRQRLLDGVQ